MNPSTKLLCLLGPLTTATLLGCAPAYHNYSGCQVNCHYCPPPPLPFTHYDDCVCHSCAAAPYLTGMPNQAAMQSTPSSRTSIPSQLGSRVE